MQSNIDDALIARFLGSHYVGRRYLRYVEIEALGLCDNRTSLQNWIEAGGFPRGIRIPGPAGKTLVWSAVEVARLIAQRIQERDASSENDEGALTQGTPSFDSNSPLPTGRNTHQELACLYSPEHP